jgi:pantetheine-phosphate adenylyltransferase
VNAIFAGTFDPPTLGHWDVIERSAPLFEKLYIVIATNTSKTPMLDVASRVEIFKQLIKDTALAERCEVVVASGLVVELCAELKVKYLVRGVRTAADVERELPMSVANELLSRGVKTILIPSTKEHSFVSSTLVREINALGGDIDPFVPHQVRKYLKKNTQEKK